MASNPNKSSKYLKENETNEDLNYLNAELVETISDPEPSYKWEIVWQHVFSYVILHIFAIIGMWKILTRAMWQTVLFCVIYWSVASMGITAGSHRLWTHRSFKAKLPLRIYLMLCQSAMFQKSIYDWVRDHRVHHKFTDTDADPYNSSRGFFFSHIGWTMLRKHRDVIEKGKTVNFSDIEADPVVQFQKKYYKSMAVLLCLVVPAHIPWYFWGEDYSTSWCLTVFRYVMSLHFTFLVNSAAHIWGMKPYDKNINPTDNSYVNNFVFGEGWHNYHHVFPWDYKSAELGDRYNPTTYFIDSMAYIGQAYDLKTVSPDIVIKRAQRSGDGSRRNYFKSTKMECQL